MQTKPPDENTRREYCGLKVMAPFEKQMLCERDIYAKLENPGEEIRSHLGCTVIR
jgi:hypothetical protein